VQERCVLTKIGKKEFGTSECKIQVNADINNLLDGALTTEQGI